MICNKPAVSLLKWSVVFFTMGWLIHSSRNINRLVQLLQHSSHCCALESEPRGPPALQFLIWHVLYVSLKAHIAQIEQQSLQSAARCTLHFTNGETKADSSHVSVTHLLLCRSPTKFMKLWHSETMFAQFRVAFCCIILQESDSIH